jgi:trimethylamine--corrinoid protein Co-methyltransferase
MERYQSAFYQPMLYDWSNFGTWTERGSRDANVRAHDIWNEILETETGPEIDENRAEALRAFIARRTEEGGALPVS